MKNFNLPKVSVIIPCYNQAQYLLEAVQSVLNQTYQIFEIIIINDGSTDNTKEVADRIKELDDRIKVIHQANLGLSAARNSGITASTGQYILPLDADDKIDAKYLELGINCLSEKNTVDVFYGEGIFFGDKTGEWDLPDFEMPLMLTRNLVYCSAIFRRTIFDKTKGYNQNMKYGWEDWDLWLSMLEQGARFYKSNEPLFYYRVKEKSMVKDIANENLKRQYLEQQLIVNHLDLYKQYFPEPLTILRELDTLRMEKAAFEKYKKEIYNSLSYRVGDFILKPFKLIRQLFK
ncbi:glycosyltransferase family 2 protein [Phaeodactylibacter luteus]|uniref:Glycosyltransferase family 2 protein n=1 Tax=Phaeodactylibacter luteus TaxID=1564516 RepID=A0A5C6RQY8_9BACT|nr:glycosyltransferase family A protein [Phaeodactylibacter luteus]TXB63802.1 glycosyltransferase family 2 protein [Phaeodactylibacter luteus]